MRRINPVASSGRLRAILRQIELAAIANDPFRAAELFTLAAWSLARPDRDRLRDALLLGPLGARFGAGRKGVGR